MRLRALDVLRALAIVLVIGRHMRSPAASENGTLRYLVSLWQTGGYSGVDLFFVLSGFLVGGLLFAELRDQGHIRVTRFLIRRGLKIYPAFYALIAFMIAWSLPLPEGPPVDMRFLSCVAAEALFVQNYFHGLFWPHTWSLAVEEHFYLTLPLLLVALRARRVEAILPLSALVGGICLALRVATAFAHPVFDERIHMFPTHLRIDSLLFGAALAYLDCFHKAKVRAFLLAYGTPVLALSLVLVAPAFFVPIENMWMHTLGYTALFIGYGGIVIVAANRAEPSGAVAGALAVVGRYSYSIYLWHRLAILTGVDAVNGALGYRMPFAIELVVDLGFAIGLGIVAAKLVEFPILRLRDRWVPRA